MRLLAFIFRIENRLYRCRLFTQTGDALADEKSTSHEMAAYYASQNNATVIRIPDTYIKQQIIAITFWHQERDVFVYHILDRSGGYISRLNMSECFHQGSFIPVVIDNRWAQIVSTPFTRKEISFVGNGVD